MGRTQPGDSEYGDPSPFCYSIGRSGRRQRRYDKAPTSLRTQSRIITGIVTLLLLGCATPAQKAAEQKLRYAAAKNLFEQAANRYHVPSADLQGTEKMKLLDLAAAGYEKVLEKYPDQKFWCAEALRSLGNARAAQGRLDEAVKIWVRVEKEYPQQDWDVLQAWKSAADQLWDAGRKDEAREFYRKIVGQFDTGEEPTLIKQIVQSARLRLVGD